jgi:hypothetical protein
LERRWFQHVETSTSQGNVHDCAFGFAAVLATGVLAFAYLPASSAPEASAPKAG